MVVEHFGLANYAVHPFDVSIEAPTFCPERTARMNPTLDPSPIFSIGEGGFGDPKGRYCANLGHKVDDESGLVYMRARYYDPTSGRFLSEDLSRDGQDWFVYCFNCPVSQTDPSGKDPIIINTSWATWLSVLSGALAADAGFVFGFLILTNMIESYVKNYSPSVPWSSTLENILLGMGSGVGGYKFNVGGGTKLENFLTRTAWANGIAFIVGFVFGTLAANDEFEMWYIDHFDQVNF